MSLVGSVRNFGLQLRTSAANLWRAVPRDKRAFFAWHRQKIGMIKEAGVKNIASEYSKTIVNLFGAVVDLLTLVGPKIRPTEAGAFAFLVHPRDITDIYRPYPFFRYLPDSLVMEISKYLPPITLSRIEGITSIDTGKPNRGVLLSIVQTPDHMIEDPSFAVRRAVQMAVLAWKKGISLIGLGALLPSLTRYGAIIKKYVPQIGVTTGHAFTSYIIAQMALKVMDIVSPGSKDVLIAIVGAAGSTGSTSARVLAESGARRLLLIERNDEKKIRELEELKEDLIKKYPRMEIYLSYNLQDVSRARIIITVTNAPQSIIGEKLLRPGMIIIDDAQPQNVSPEIVKNRKDILVLKVLVKVPGLEPNFDFGLGTPPDVTFTCLAETAVLSSIGYGRDFTVGRVKPSQLETIARLARQYGASLPDVFYSFNGETISPEEIKRVGQLWKE